MHGDGRCVGAGCGERSLGIVVPALPGLDDDESLRAESPSLERCPEIPDGIPGRSLEPASTLDIVPTALAAAGLPVPERLPGRPLQNPAREAVIRVAE